MRPYFSYVRIGAVLAGVLILVGGYALLFPANFRESNTIGNARSFDELSGRFQKLAQEKGAEYAFEVLRRAPLPSGTDLHLLGHIVGDELYAQKGIDGIGICTQEFRNACSHTIVIGALNEYGGEAALPKIRDACKKAPGGTGAYTMCYHGLGHGVFAYYAYDLEKTAVFCKKTATAEYREREYEECMGGAVMELMGGGGHDRASWEKARARYFSSSDPLAPCTKGVMPEDARGICLVYITPHLFEAAGGNLASPNEGDFRAAFAMCDTLPARDVSLRSACFNGIGKEFPVLAMHRDIRNLSQASDAQLLQMRTWCDLAPHDDARGVCMHALLESLFWGGENDPALAVRLCNVEDTDEREARCFGELTGIGEYYVPAGSPLRTRLCNLMPEQFAAECRTRIL